MQQQQVEGSRACVPSSAVKEKTSKCELDTCIDREGTKEKRQPRQQPQQQQQQQQATSKAATAAATAKAAEDS
ncbi:hypothetical protein Emag_006341 [Eimeria magna]